MPLASLASRRLWSGMIDINVVTLFDRQMFIRAFDITLNVLSSIHIQLYRLSRTPLLSIPLFRYFRRAVPPPRWITTFHRRLRTSTRLTGVSLSLSWSASRTPTLWYVFFALSICVVTLMAAICCVTARSSFRLSCFALHLSYLLSFTSFCFRFPQIPESVVAYFMAKAGCITSDPNVYVSHPLSKLSILTC